VVEALSRGIPQQKLLRRVSTVLDNLEALYHEAQRMKGTRWCHEEALWVSWPLEKFGDIILAKGFLAIS